MQFYYFIILARPMDFDLRFGEDIGVGSSSLMLKNDITVFTVAFWMKVAEVDSGDPGTPLSYAVEHQGYYPFYLKNIKHFPNNLFEK
jgi:hypothetical protein